MVFGFFYLYFKYFLFWNRVFIILYIHKKCVRAFSENNVPGFVSPQRFPKNSNVRAGGVELYKGYDC